MRRCVLDASVVVKWYLDEDSSEAARTMQGQEFDVAAPQFLLVEVANVLWKHSRKGALDSSTASEILAALEQAPIRWHEDMDLFQGGFLLATQTGRTVYDCLYLALARQSDRSLITADRKFFDAIRMTPEGSRVVWIEDVVE